MHDFVRSPTRWRRRAEVPQEASHPASFSLCIHLFIYLFIHVLLSDTLAMSPSGSLSLLVIQPPRSWKTHRASPSHPPMDSILHSLALKYNMLRQGCWHREPSENCWACIKETHTKNVLARSSEMTCRGSHPGVPCVCVRSLYSSAGCLISELLLRNITAF